MHEVIQSSVFRMAKSIVLKEMLILYGKPWIISFFTLILICGILSVCHDLRWIIIGLMTVFIICPMFIAFLYIYHGLKPLTVLNTIPHKLEFTIDQFSITCYTVEEGQEDSENKYTELSSKNYTYSSISSFKVGINSIILLMKSQEGFLWIPTDIFPKKISFSTILDFICQGMRKNQQIE